MPTLVGKQFPDLSVDAMNEMGDTFKINVLEEAKKNNKKVLLFWYPKDFTFVCPTELQAFQAAIFVLKLMLYFEKIRFQYLFLKGMCTCINKNKLRKKHEKNTNHRRRSSH